MLTITSLFGRVLQGYVADQIRWFNVVMITTAVLGTLVLILWLLSENGVQIFVFAGLYGFLASAFTSLASAMISQISSNGPDGNKDWRTVCCYVCSNFDLYELRRISVLIANIQITSAFCARHRRPSLEPLLQLLPKPWTTKIIKLSPQQTPWSQARMLSDEDGDL